MADRQPDDASPSGGSKLDRLLDISVFAPLGLLLERHDIVSRLAEVGRRQVAFSRSLGQAAMRTLAKGAKTASHGRGSAAPTTSRDADASSSADMSAATPEPAPVTAEREIRRPSPIDGYETMTARELIACIPELSDAEADWLRSAETTGKNRVTVLRALDARSD